MGIYLPHLELPVDAPVQSQDREDSLGFGNEPLNFKQLNTIVGQVFFRIPEVLVRFLGVCH